MFQPQYVLSSATCADEDSAPGGCNVLACADIAARVADYAGRAKASPAALKQARAYLGFLEKKYREEGVLWDAYAYADGNVLTTSGHPHASMVIYVFLAKLAMALGTWDLAEKIFMEQVIPNQVFPGNDHPGASPAGSAVDYLGAFKPRVATPQSCWDDAMAFPNLETVAALHEWNTRAKTGWTSSYPRWKTIKSIKSSGGLDEIPLDPVEARYIRFLLKKPGGTFGNYSMYEIEVTAPDGSFVKIANASASTVQWDPVANKAWTANLVFDGISECDSRWSSTMPPSTTPAADRDGSEYLQWIYVDLGAKTRIAKLMVYWDASYAAEYELQQSD
jgi:hypothetical protein